MATCEPLANNLGSPAKMRGTACAAQIGNMAVEILLGLCVLGSMVRWRKPRTVFCGKQGGKEEFGELESFDALLRHSGRCLNRRLQSERTLKGFPRLEGMYAQVNVALEVRSYMTYLLSYPSAFLSVKAGESDILIRTVHS